MSHLLVSAAHKSSGKTTVSIGLCAALTSLDNTVQAFKKGPDYIDPLWLGRATGRDCYNLDFFTMSRNEIQNVFVKQSADAGISIIEGNKGLYDGLDLDGSNSNAALAELLYAPVILVIDARGMTRGIAPLILGYQAFDPDINIGGVILNQIGGSRHESKLRAVIEHYTDAKVLGAVHRDASLSIDERHLGLMPSNEFGAADKKIAQLGAAIKEQVDLHEVIKLADTAKKIEPVFPLPIDIKVDGSGLRIGIVKDEAFGFYYPGDVQAMRETGAELVEINTLEDKALPELDGLFIGGGFPETRMQALENNQSMRQSIRQQIEQGLPVYAECGGLMYLARQISWQGETHQMVGAIQGDVLMHEKPQGRGYVRLKARPGFIWPLPNAADEVDINAHEFHYSSLENLDEQAVFEFDVLRGTGIKDKQDGYRYKNLLACYTHMRDTGMNHWVVRFVQFIRDCKSADSTSADVKLA